MHRRTIAAFAAAITAAAALAAPQASLSQEPPVLFSVQDDFENVTFAVEDAILNAGLVIDFISHTGEMLERTRTDIGSDRVLFTDAQIFSFCSAAVSREVLEADLANLQNCPYNLFVYERPEMPGTIFVGHRAYEGSMAPVGQMLSGIVQEALGE